MHLLAIFDVFVSPFQHHFLTFILIYIFSGVEYFHFEPKNWVYAN